MTVDASVQALIDAALAPVKADVAGLKNDVAALSKAQMDPVHGLLALDARVTALEGATPPPPVVTPPTGVPVIPAGPYLYKADFSTAPDSTPTTLASTLMAAAKMRVLTIPSDPNHLSVADGGTAKATDPMARWNRYSAKNISIAGGVLHQAATRRSDGLYDASFVGTCDDGHGGAATFSFGYGQVDFAFRCNIGYVTWTTPLWLIGWIGGAWESSEIDALEQIEGKLTNNIHGPASAQFGAIAPPADLASAWHLGHVVKNSTGVTVALDGKILGSWVGAMPHAQAIVSDVKVGVPWKNLGPTSATPDPLWLDLAWITVR